MTSQPQVLAKRYAAGLSWRPLVADGAVPAVALARAREEHASMYVHDGVTPVVGLCNLAKKAAPKTLFALAGMAAKAYPVGEAVFALRVEQACWWVGATAAGVPQLDLLVHSLGEARAAVDRAQQSRRGAAVYGDQQVHESCQALTLANLQPYESPAVQVRSTRTKLPAWSYAVAFAALAALAYQQGPSMLQRYVPREPVAVKPAVDPVAAWAAANAAWLKQVKGPLGSDLQALRDRLYGVPLEVGGWQLTSVTCKLTSLWRCAIGYRRPTGIDSTSTNRTFENSRPKDWTVVWKGATDVTASMTIDRTATTALAPEDHVVPMSVYQVDTYSEFQELSRAFQKVEVLDMARAEVAAPKDSEGKPVPRPAPGQVPEIFRATVSFTGPLRNLELVEQMKAPVFWTEIATVRGLGDKPSISSSEFTAVMKGEIYAKRM